MYFENKNHFSLCSIICWPYHATFLLSIDFDSTNNLSNYTMSTLGASCVKIVIGPMGLTILLTNLRNVLKMPMSVVSEVLLTSAHIQVRDEHAS